MNRLRSHRRYTQTRAAWLAGYAGGLGTCALCGRPVDTSLPGTHPWGPTIEHTIPIRRIHATAATPAEALALACDTSLWALAHLHCQRQQGARAAAQRRQRRRPQTMPGQSRQW